MCGIVGVLGMENAASVVRGGLQRLEYRGYDSAGIAWNDQPGIEVQKAPGRVQHLPRVESESTMAVGHTRWATHGEVNAGNAHPHLDATGRFAIVHNGTIEGHLGIRRGLEEAGHTLASDTDSELIVHLYERERREADPIAALRSTLGQLAGSWAMIILDREADLLAFARHRTPLVLGLVGEGKAVLASDVTALLEHTRDVVYLEDGDHGVVSSEGVHLFGADGRKKQVVVEHVEWQVEEAEKAGHPHFMLKEIFDAPVALNQCLGGRIRSDPSVVHLGLDSDLLEGVRRVRLVACGTSHHAALVGRHFIESWAGLPAEAVVASDLRDRRLLEEPGTLSVGISQSGETLDTLEALRRVQGSGGTVLAITNVHGSSLDRMADATLLTRVGPEIGVAATKTFLGQVTVLALLALQWADKREMLPVAQRERLIEQLSRMPRTLEQVLENEEDLRELGTRLSDAHSLFFLGRGVHTATALEAALKFKEITYCHAEGFGTGELKHGPFALLSKETPCLFFVPADGAFDKNVASIMEVRARGAPTYAFLAGDQEGLDGVCDRVITTPPVDPSLSVLPMSLAAQLVAYHAAANLGREIDQPRNLVKSVTVE